MRIVEIGREVVTGMGWSLAHVDDGISHLRWQALDMFRTPGIVVPSRAAASERGLIGKAKGMLKNNLVTFLGASFSELWCSSIPHESHEETC